MHSENQLTDSFPTRKEHLLPMRILCSRGLFRAEDLLCPKTPALSFTKSGCTRFEGRGAYVLLDFGKELCGGLRILTREAEPGARLRIRLGESLSEACAEPGEKNAGNDHAPRDFEIPLPALSDLSYGQSGFRFARLELLSAGPCLIRSIFAFNILPHFPRGASIVSDDAELNAILATAAYTLTLCMQNGFIWDGIKRDRLAWCGDLHQEMLSAFYLYGDCPHIRNSLSLLIEDCEPGAWVNEIPSYSAWWLLCLCDYVRLSGQRDFFARYACRARALLEALNRHVLPAGAMDFHEASLDMPYFLDWASFETEDAVTGTGLLILMAAKAWLALGAFPVCHELIGKLEGYCTVPCQSKQAKALQILAAGKATPEDAALLEQDGASGFSTFMAYYILRADALSGGKEMLNLLKRYFGGMLERGATTFWEDFDLAWLEGSGRIDALPEPGQKDLHGDFGAHCYKGFRHSLCHGWSAGLIAFVVEEVIGLRLEDGGRKYSLRPNLLGLRRIRARIPVAAGWLDIRIDGEGCEVRELSEAETGEV